jgi:hypothetical protein
MKFFAKVGGGKSPNSLVMSGNPAKTHYILVGT